MKSIGGLGFWVFGSVFVRELVLVVLVLVVPVLVLVLLVLLGPLLSLAPWWW